MYYMPHYLDCLSEKDRNVILEIGHKWSQIVLQHIQIMDDLLIELTPHNKCHPSLLGLAKFAQDSLGAICLLSSRPYSTNDIRSLHRGIFETFLFCEFICQSNSQNKDKAYTLAYLRQIEKKNRQLNANTNIGQDWRKECSNDKIPINEAALNLDFANTLRELAKSVFYLSAYDVEYAAQSQTIHAGLGHQRLINIGSERLGKPNGIPVGFENEIISVCSKIRIMLTTISCFFGLNKKYQPLIETLNDQINNAQKTIPRIEINFT